MECLMNTDLQCLIIRFTNAYILNNEELIYGDLWVCNGAIIDGLKLFFHQKQLADITIDVGGNVISPGFIDIQINGGYGFNFSDSAANMVEVCQKVASKLPEFGVTSFCPTIITLDKSDYAIILPEFGGYQNFPGAAKVIGVHLEGPFISKLRAGMHDKTNIRDLGNNAVQTVNDTYGSDFSMITLVTIAPEIEGSDEAIRFFRSKGVSVSIGHTDADCDTLEKAVSSGARFITHLFNAMPLFHHREAHVFGSIISPTPALHVGVIADLLHVHPAALRVADAIAPGRVVLVTDANTSFGLPDGRYSFGNQTIVVTDGAAYLPDSKCLAGGTTSLLTCIRNYWLEVTYQNSILTGKNRKRVETPSNPKTDGSLNTCPWLGLGEALAAASTRPARGLGLLDQSLAVNSDGKSLPVGCLEPGFVADFTILAPRIANSGRIDAGAGDLELLATWINGRPVHIKPFCQNIHVERSS